MAANIPGHVARTSEFAGFLSPVEAGPIFEKAEQASVVQQLAEKIPTGPSGTAYTEFTGTVTAGWVGETGKKPKTKGGLSRMTVEPHKIATIFVSSAETVRANPGGYLQQMRSKVGTAIARAFDLAALFGTNTPFDNYLAETTKAVSFHADAGNAYAQTNAVLAALVNDDKDLTGFALDNRTEPLLNAALDLNGRPLFTDDTTETNAVFRRGRMLGRPTFVGKGVGSGTTLGFAGDWSQIKWGQVGGISYDVSDQATLDLSDAQDGTGMTSLWEHNLIAVRVEAEFVLVINDVESFVEVTNVDPTP